MQVFGVHAELLQFTVLVGHNLREKLVQAHKALQVFTEQVELIDLLAGLFQRVLGFFQAATVAVSLGRAFEVQRLLA
ncbi:hypothetical protein D3C81_1669930 [compost metagenome]